MDSEVGWVLQTCRACGKLPQARSSGPSRPPSAPSAKPPEAKSPPQKGKPVACKTPDVVDATRGDSEDGDDSNGGDDEEEDGGDKPPRRLKGEPPRQS